MTLDDETGVFLSLEDCKCIFKKLKRDEAKLSNDELAIFGRIEKVLFSKLSIREIEELTN